LVKGTVKESWALKRRPHACSAGYDLRSLFEFA